ncbi:nuclear transport factor 2 family protein [Rhodanobacter umsongensis]|uniref:Nuclear transport factor 2 family protein n=1 Tax=Rhodanobacter umsongensis TaxID=633153 RepID=A0ABW0JH59_9GAMM
MPKLNLNGGKHWLLALLMVAASTAAAAEPSRLTRDLLHAEADVCQAFEAGHADALRRALTADFTLVDSHGNVTNLEQNLGEVATREPHYEVFHNHDQQVRLYGDTALIVGITSIRGRAGGKPFVADFRYTDTWIRRRGAWLLAASHASRLP